MSNCEISTPVLRIKCQQRNFQMGKSHFFSIIILCCLIFTHALAAQEFLSGQVLDINEKKNEFMMHLESPPENVEGLSHRKESIRVRSTMENALSQHSDGTFLPRCVAVGSHVRVWGHWENPGQDLLLAHDIKGCAGGGCADPTGILSRLKKALGLMDKQSADKSVGRAGSGGASAALSGNGSNGNAGGNASGGGSGGG